MEVQQNNPNLNDQFVNANPQPQPNPNQRLRQPRSHNRRDRNPQRQSPAQSTMKQITRFLTSWRFNVFLMIINTLMITAYTLIIHHQHFKDHSFTIDMLMDSEKVPQPFLWGVVFVLCHFIFIYHKSLERSMLEWKPYPQNPSQIDNNQNANANHNHLTIVDTIVQEHYFYSLLVLYLMDKNTVFPTFFEIMIFSMVYTFHSFVIASEQLIYEFNKKIIETQISFSSSLLLMKNEVFQRRIKKIESYQLYLLLSSVAMTIFIGWLFLYSGLVLVSLLLYPGIKNCLKLVQDIYNFRYQVNQSLALITNDDQIITKMHINFTFNIAIKFLDLTFCTMIFYIGGWSLGYFPMIHIFILQQILKQVQQFYQEIEKLRKFRNFLRNINNDYPLVIFNNTEHEKEDCAICKEVMTQARRLPCNHCFHWFCIIQLIESGSRNCPICRGEFNNNSNRQQNNINGNPQNNRAGGNIFSFRLGGWLPNISVRMVRNRTPAIPFNQALERIREIFPYLSTAQIGQELRAANGHIDQAILNISENVQRGMYPGINQ